MTYEPDGRLPRAPSPVVTDEGPIDQEALDTAAMEQANLDRVAADEATLDRAAIDQQESDRARMDSAAIEVREPLGTEAARERFGGLDLPAAFAGMLVALSALLLLAGLASVAIGAIAFRTGIQGNQQEISLGALITAGVVIFLAFLFGGWAAGRMARYSGALNGLMVAVWFIVVLAVLAALGAIAGNAYNLFDNLLVAKASLPDWFSGQDVTTGAIISSIAFAVVMVVGAVLGGLWGTRMHRAADRTIETTRSEVADGDDRMIGRDAP